MILKGAQRGNGHELAVHLLKPENERVELHELRGFMADDLHGAFKEAHAVSRGTKCRQYLFSLSLNPPEDIGNDEYEQAIGRVEERLGLANQPRAIVFHEKDGRRHCHAVWSRIDIDRMKAVQLSHTRVKLQSLSKDLYREHGWQMPRGYVDKTLSDPRNYSHAQWQQAKRAGHDPRLVKTAFQDAWAASDSGAAFVHAMQERGFKVARGDRRGFVAVDYQGEVYAIPKWADVKTKAVRDRLGDGENLPSVADAKAQVADDMLAKLKSFEEEVRRKQAYDDQKAKRDQEALTTRQEQERQKLEASQKDRAAQEEQMRQARFRTGLKGLWDTVRGETGRIKKQNAAEVRQSQTRDTEQKQALHERQSTAKQALGDKQAQTAASHESDKQELQQDALTYQTMKNDAEAERRRAFIEKRQSTATKTRTRIRGPTPGR